MPSKSITNEVDSVVKKAQTSNHRTKCLRHYETGLLPSVSVCKYIVRPFACYAFMHFAF